MVTVSFQRFCYFQITSNAFLFEFLQRASVEGAVRLHSVMHWIETNVAIWRRIEPKGSEPAWAANWMSVTKRCKMPLCTEKDILKQEFDPCFGKQIIARAYSILNHFRDSKKKLVINNRIGGPLCAQLAASIELQYCHGARNVSDCCVYPRIFFVRSKYARWRQNGNAVDHREPGGGIIAQMGCNSRQWGTVKKTLRFVWVHSPVLRNSSWWDVG